MKPNDPEAILGARLDRSGGPDACWIWTAGRSPRGYGKVRVRNKDWRAHRLAYAVWRGSIPDGMRVCHSCDNPPCCNPAHLFLGTDADNIRDKWAKGRGRTNRTRGEERPVSKLTAESVLELRRRYAAGESSLRLAAAFGVGANAVLNAVSGTTWGHVPGAIQPRPAATSKLRPEQEAAIRAVPQYWGVNAALARQYGVSAPTIAHIRAKGVAT